MMKPIPYISPQALLSISLEENLDASLIKKQKKRFLAEFELNGAAEIDLNGISFDKSGLIAFFDSLGDPTEIAFHQFVASHPTLKLFLESGELGFFQERFQDQFRKEESFTPEMLSKITPFYCYQYNKVFSQAFKKRDWESLTLINSSKPLVAIDHYTQCYQDTYQYLQLKIEHLEELGAKIKKGESPGPEVQDACDEVVIDVLNLLPGHFDGLRNAYGSALEELAMGVYNEHKRSKLTKLILRQGLKLSLNQDTRGKLSHVLDQLLKIEPDDSFFPEMEETVTENVKKIKGWHIALAGVVLITIVRMIMN